MRFALAAAIAFALGSGQAALSGEEDVKMASHLDGAIVPIDTDRASGTARWSSSAESAKPKLDSYIAHLERGRLIYRRGWLKRGRVIRAQRRRFHRSLYSSPVGNHWLENAFLCIKQHEGGWSSATGNGFYGGLQMDRSFQRSYGSEYASLGPANRWPRSVQIAVAIKAYLNGRGFGPWPNTRKLCGL